MSELRLKRAAAASAAPSVISAAPADSGRTIPSESIRRATFPVQGAPGVDPIQARVTVVNSEKQPIVGATVTAIADNNTTKTAISSSHGNGMATIAIATRRLYQLLVAHPTSWDPSDDLTVTLFTGENTGSVICFGTGFIPGLEGRLNPILDTYHRTYLYADNIAINGGVQQPATFEVDVPFELQDSIFHTVWNVNETNGRRKQRCHGEDFR